MAQRVRALLPDIAAGTWPMALVSMPGVKPESVEATRATWRLRNVPAGGDSAHSRLRVTGGSG